MFNNNKYNNNNQENMFGIRNDYERGESSSLTPRRYDEHDSPHADHDASLMSFRNLRLSDEYYSNSQEVRRPNRNQLSASSSEYLPLPVTLGDALNSRTRPSFAQHNTGTPYYPAAPSSYLRETLPFYTPHLPNFPVTNLNSFTSQALSPNAASYHYFSNPSFRDLTAAAFPSTQPDHTDFTLSMLSHILTSPYEYMTTQDTCHSLTNLLYQSRKYSFVDDFVKAVTKSQDSLIAAACHPSGTGVVQALIKAAKKRPVIGRVPLLLADATVPLMTHPAGMHVIRYCFVELDATKNQPLFEKMMEDDNWLKIASDKNGCRGLNECIDYMVGSFKTRILDRIVEFTKELALDVYGNYVLQHVVDIDTVHAREIVERIMPFLESLCTIKNGSHLLEKCIETSHYAAIINGLADSSRLLRLAVHECGNYVIQKAILRTQKAEDHSLYCKLVEKLLKEKVTLMANRHGRFVAKYLPEQRDDGNRTHYQRHC